MWGFDHGLSPVQGHDLLSDQPLMCVILWARIMSRTPLLCPQELCFDLLLLQPKAQDSSNP